MEEPKAKKRLVRSKVKSANSPSPMPMMAKCGHSSCGEQCNVRYVGATSHISHHHIMHAARGVAHVWTAAIIAGLAVVITGAVALATANAQAREQDDMRSAQATGQVLDKLDALETRLNALEKDVTSLHTVKLNDSSTPDLPQN